MIDERMEDGLSEDEAVDGIGSVKEMADSFLREIPIKKIVKEKVKKTRRFETWEVILLVVTAPLWVSLLVVALSVALSIYVTLWSAVIVFYAVAVSMVAVGIAGIGGSIVMFATGKMSGLFLLGAGITLLGLSLFVFLGSNCAARGMVLLLKKVAMLIKYMFVGKESEK